MEKKKLAIINEVLDKAMDKIHNEEFSLQKSDQRKELGKRTFYQKVKIHSTAKSCIYPGCPNRSIKKSHSIQKSGVLNNISDNNHVYKPEVDMTQDEPVMEMKEIGINIASTFPGFCREHERLFYNFENKGVIDLKEEANLQTYRSICREKVFRENEREIVKHQRNTYKKALQKLAKQYVMDELTKRGITVKNDQISFTKINDDFLHLMDAKNTSLTTSINELDEYMVATLTSNENEYVSHEFIIDYSFPICIAGFGNQYYEYSGKKRNFLLILNVIPYKNKTVIICSSLKKHEEIFKSVINYYTQNILTILNFIESFMVNSSDHWFIRPSFWDSLPKMKREYILQCLLYTKESFLEEIQYSIFDDIRIYFIDAFLNSRNGVPLTNIEESFLNTEKLKLSKQITLKPRHEVLEGMMGNFDL